MTNEDDPAGRPCLDRRHLLTAVGTLAMSASAGCTVSLEDGIAIEFGDGADDGTSTTTDYGYGGSPTTTATATSTSVPTAPDEGSDEDSSTVEPTSTATDTEQSTATTTDTPTATPTTTDTATPTSTATSTPEDDYGEQGYGQYQYGG